MMSMSLAGTHLLLVAGSPLPLCLRVPRLLLDSIGLHLTVQSSPAKPWPLHWLVFSVAGLRFGCQGWLLLFIAPVVSFVFIFEAMVQALLFMQA